MAADWHARGLRLYAQGKTLQQVADRCGVSRERVRQVLEKHGVKPRPSHPPLLPWVFEAANIVLTTDCSATDACRKVKIPAAQRRSAPDRLRRYLAKRGGIPRERKCQFVGCARVFVKSNPRELYCGRHTSYQVLYQRRRLAGLCCRCETPSKQRAYCPACLADLAKFKDRSQSSRTALKKSRSAL